MSLRHLSPRNNAYQPSSISSERDYNYHIKHSNNNYINTFDKSYHKSSSIKYNSYLSYNKLLLDNSKFIDSKNQLLTKHRSALIDNNNNNNYSTCSIPSKLRSIYNYGNNTFISSVINKKSNINTNNSKTSNNSINNISKDQHGLLNTKSRSHCHSPIVHVRNTIRNDGFSFLKHLHKSKRHTNIRGYNNVGNNNNNSNNDTTLINSSYDDVLSLSRFDGNNISMKSDTLSLNKYSLSTYRPEDSFVKYYWHENRSLLNHQKSQSQQQLLLLDKSNSLKSSDNHNKYTTNISSSNSSNNNNTQLSDKLPRYNNQQHQLQRYQSDSSSENPTEVINIAPTISGISSTENGTSTITSITTTATTSIQVSSNRNSYAPRVVPPLIGINEIHTTNENDSNSTSELLDDKNTRYLSHSYRNQCSKNTLLNHHDIVSDYNSDHNNEFNDNNVDDADDRDDDAADENVYSDHFHIGWNDSIQSKIWLPKVAMNSNRLKLDEVMSTDWNLLTTKNWKSEQEIKKKMNRHINNNNNSNNTNNIKNKGVSWFRERSSNIKPLNYITRRQSDRQNEMKQSKGIKINSLMNHTSIRHNQHSSASNHKSQYDPVSEPVDIFSLPTVKVKYPNDDSLTTSMTNSNYNNKLTNKYKVNKSSLQFAYITTTDDEANKRTKVKTRQINNDSNRNTTINSHSNNNNNNNNRNNNNDRKKDTYPVSTDSDTSVLGYVDLTTATTTTTTTTVTTTVNNKVLSKECQNANKTDKPPTVTLSTRGSSQNLPNHTATHLDGPSSARQRHHQSQQHHQQQQPQPPPLPQKQQQTRVPDGDDDANAVAVQAKNSDHENKPSELITPSRTVHNLTSGNQNEKSREKSILIEQQKINQLEFRKMSTLPDNDYDNDDRDRDGLKSNGKMTIPMTPHTALNIYGKKLTSFERDEILNFSKIWYLGLSAQKIEGIVGSPSNHGYDDETGGYLKITHDHIAYRFQALETLGKGSFGRVIRAIDHKSGFPVAIKIIRNRKRFHQQAQVEVAILENLRKADHRNIHNIIHIREHFIFRNHLCIVFDLLGSNLYDLLRKNDFRGFTIHSLKKITVKLLTCLCLLRKQGIIHCDLKPENILIGLNNPSELKVIDFGSSCFLHQKTYTYIQSRFYRAPEIILGIPYDLPIDMWSLGCILPELYTGRPLFPGENENEQLACIMEVLGVPPESLLEKASRRRVFFDSKRSPKHLINSRGRRRIPGSQTLEDLVKTVDSKFLNLLSQCLTWDPEERITPNEAMTHEWISRENEQNKQATTFQSLEQSNSETIQKDTIG